jgi:hypothetical protein
MEKKTNIIEKTFLFSWPYAALVAFVIFMITQSWDDVLSFILGTFTGLMMNSLQYRIMKQAFEFTPQTIRSKTIWLYFAKMIVYAVILYFTANNPEWNVYYVAFGVLSYRLVLLAITLIVSLKKAGDADGS